VSGLKMFLRGVKEGTLSIEEHTARILDEIEQMNKNHNYFAEITKDEALQQAKGIADKKKSPLAGIPVSVKDNLCVKGVQSRAGSKILEGYKPVMDATAVANVKKQGAIIIGKTAQDEFGFGSFGVNAGLGFEIPVNPIDEKRVTGGSSSGAAGFTALTKFSHAAIAESTGGSIAMPAAYCGVVGFTPTYGRVSRYGLIDYANSLDKIGTMGKTVEDAAMLLQHMMGLDLKDSTSADKKVPNLLSAADESVKRISIGVPKEFFKNAEPGTRKIVEDAISGLEKEGAEIMEVDLPLNQKYALPSYYVLSMSEASTNLARYCGMRYGLHSELAGTYTEYFTKVRSENFGIEAKRRILLGSFARMAGFRDELYMKAALVRSKLIKEFKQALNVVDIIATPVTPDIAPKISEVEKLTPWQHYCTDIFTVPPNLAGLPHISVPAGEEKGMPVGILLTANNWEEEKLVTAAAAVEKNAKGGKNG